MRRGRPRQVSPSEELKHAVRSARNRLILAGWISAASWSLLVGFGAFALLVACDRLFSFGWSWRAILTYLSATALVASLVWTLLTAADSYTAAIEIDQRLELRERVTSSLTAVRSRHPMADLVLADAVGQLRKKNVAVAFRLTIPPAEILAVAAFLIALGVAWWMPQFDLLGRGAERTERIEEAATAQEAVKLLKNRIQEKAGLLADSELPQAARMLSEIDRLTADAFAKPPKDRKEALVGLSRLTDRLKSKSPARNALAVKQALRKLAAEGGGTLDDMQKSLRKGQFQQAARKLEELKQKLAKGEFSREETAQLALDLGKLSAALEKLASQGELAAQLENKGLSEAERQALKEKLAALKESLASLEEMSSIMDQLSRELCQGKGLGRMCADLDKLGDLLDQLEAMNAQADIMASLFNDLEEIKYLLADSKRTGKGLCACGEKGIRRLGAGMKGPGWGVGGIAKTSPHDTDTFKTRVKGELGEGEPVASWFVSGSHVKPDARTPFYDVVASAERKAADALAKERIPPSYGHTVKEYFHAVRRGEEE